MSAGWGCRRGRSITRTKKPGWRRNDLGVCATSVPSSGTVPPSWRRPTGVSTRSFAGRTRRPTWYRSPIGRADRNWCSAMAKASATAPSAHRLFHKRGDLGLFAGSQLAERVLNRPHGAVVDFRLVAEAERLVSDFELPCVLEVTDHVAILGVGGHSVPRFRRESRSGGCDQCVDPLGNGAIRLLHSGDSRKQLRFPIRLGRLGLELPDTLARRRLFFGAESLG